MSDELFTAVDAYLNDLEQARDKQGRFRARIRFGNKNSQRTSSATGMDSYFAPDALTTYMRSKSQSQVEQERRLLRFLHEGSRTGGK